MGKTTDRIHALRDSLHIINKSNGRPWLVRIVRTGDKYGRDDCLTHDEDKALVEYYDLEHASDRFDARGQFVSRYYAGTLLGHDGFYGDGNRNTGILLHGAEPEVWSIDAATQRIVLDWLDHQLACRS